MWCGVLCCVELYCVVLCCVVVWCVELWCVVLCCVVLCSATLNISTLHCIAMDRMIQVDESSLSLSCLLLSEQSFECMRIHYRVETLEHCSESKNAQR